MKGLLIKDMYMLTKYFKLYFVLIPLFLIAWLFNSSNSFFLLYPVLLLALIPVNLISYDEKSKWDRYCGALPCTRAAMVSAKYIILLCCIVLVFLLSVVILLLGVKSGVSSSIVRPSLMMLFGTGLIGPSISLPVIYKFGADKGRIVSLFIFGALIALTGFANSVSLSAASALGGQAEIIVYPLGITIYALSWLLSIKFYKSKEL